VPTRSATRHVADDAGLRDAEHRLGVVGHAQRDHANVRLQLEQLAGQREASRQRLVDQDDARVMLAGERQGFIGLFRGAHHPQRSLAGQQVCQSFTVQPDLGDDQDREHRESQEPPVYPRMYA